MMIWTTKSSIIIASCLLTSTLSAQQLPERKTVTEIKKGCVSPNTFEITENESGDVLISWEADTTHTYHILYRDPIRGDWSTRIVDQSPAKLSGLSPGIYEFAVQIDCAGGDPVNKQGFKLKGKVITQENDTIVNSETASETKRAHTDNDEIIATDFVVREIETFPEIPKIVAKAVNATRAENDGHIEVSVTDGHGPYLFSIDGTRFQKEPRFKKLKSGNYTITVKDSKNVTATAHVIVKRASN